jgi:hypothetical protein
MFNQNDLRSLQERQKDLRREVEQERLAKQSRTRHQTERTTQKKISLWMRVWLFL